MLNVKFVLNYRDTKPYIRQNVDEGSLQVDVWRLRDQPVDKHQVQCSETNRKHDVQRSERNHQLGTQPLFCVINRT